MDRETLKKWFRTGAKPTEAQFAELIDSFRHVDEKLKVSDVENLAALIAQKMTREDALTLHEALSKSISELEELKATPEGVREAIEQYHATQEWNEESNLNDYTETGVYHFSGYRLSAVDNLPIESVGETVNIAFTLIVDAHEGKLENSTHVPCIVSQTLFLGNRQGSETRAYVRNCTMFHDGQADAWEPWRELMQTTYLGILRESYTGETLKTCTENGLYTGAIFRPSSDFYIFKLEVMNNYAIAKIYGTESNTVWQTLTLLHAEGNEKILQRKGTWNGSGYDWDSWENVAKENIEVEKARQNVLGTVMGGRNVRIGADGSVNVDDIYLKNTDTDTSDGVLDDSIVRVNPNITIDEAMYNHQDKSGSTLSLYEEVGLFGYEITATSDSEYRDFTLASAITTIDPNTTSVLVQDIWRRAYDRFLYLCSNDYSDYTTLQMLRSGLCRYPYYTGYYKFELMLSEGTAKSGARFYLTSRDGVRQGELEHVGNGVYELRISNFKETTDTYTLDFSKLLPFRIEADYTGSTVWDYNGVSLCIHTVQKSSSEVVDEYNSRVLFCNFQKTTENSDGYTDRTRNVLLCSDGILLQGRNQSCYIRINDAGNIETNIGEFITQ